MIIKSALLVSALIIGSISEAMQVPSLVGYSRFRALAVYAQAYLRDNMTRLACQKNESGFIRINVPTPKGVDSTFEGIKKVRLNYWEPTTGVVINPESIHNHPNYFESLVMKGGYTHQLYETGKPQDPAYDLYRIIKNGSKKSFAFISQTNLRSAENESVKRNDIVIFPLSMIHRVLNTEPGTLSLNTIFEDEDRQSSYDVFLTQNGTMNDVKTERELVPNDQSIFFIKKIDSAINDFMHN